MKHLFSYTLILSAVFAFCLPVKADITLPNVLTSHMVLQREKPVPIWGKAAPGEKVTVVFGKQKLTTFAGSDSTWSVTFKPMKASTKGRSMTISGSQTLTLEDILVGEVWLCGGQSNMEYPMDIKRKNYVAPQRGSNLADQALAQDEDPLMRVLLIAKKRSLPDCTTAGWMIADRSSLTDLSALGYFFGKEIQSALSQKVPIGLISSSWGGSRIEAWTPLEAYAASPIFTSKTAKGIDGYAKPGDMYYSMIKPLAPYALRGFIWYQGESNAMVHDSLYVEKTELLVHDWRTIFQDEDLPFYFVQLAPYAYTKRNDKLKHPSYLLPEFWEMQTICLQIPHTGMAVTTDLVDDLKNIHPSYKWEVGRRLSLWALQQVYGKKNIVYSGPKYKSMQVQGNKIILDFDYKADGLMSAERYNSPDNLLTPRTDNALTWFTIAGEDGHFVEAIAHVVNNKVEVYSPQVAQPKQVRFAWNESAMPNLYNSEGLPALPFRTDNLPLFRY